MGRPDVVTSQMLVWVMPWLTLRALYGLIDLIINGINKDNRSFDFLSLGLASVIVNGACWSGVLFGFIKTAANPGPWNWSHLQTKQPAVAPYSIQAAPMPPSFYAPQGGPLPMQYGWGQNNIPQQQAYYQPYAPPNA